MHWTAGQLAGLLRHPFVPDCIPLYHRISFNLFLNYFKLYLIVNNDKLRMAPVVSSVSLKPVQCIAS